MSGPKRIPSRGRPARTFPPPERTGREATYLEELRAAGTPVSVTLLDGSTLDGVLEEIHAATILLRSADGRRVLLPKAELRSLAE